MISGPELRRIARERKLGLDIIEKDYVLGWILIGVSLSSLSDKIIFKGGTALSKVHFPSGWRISEDLDFTLSEGSTLADVSNGLVNELPKVVEEVSDGLVLNFRKKPFSNPNFLRVRVQCNGPITRNTVKIEVSTENFIGNIDTIQVPPRFDYPIFNILSYTLDNILAEKMRAIIERAKIRDYYDVWRLLKTEGVDVDSAKELFLHTCEAKSIEFSDIEQFFPEDVVETLEPYLETGLTRLSSDPLPPLTQIIEEMKVNLTQIFTNENEGSPYTASGGIEKNE